MHVAQRGVQWTCVVTGKAESGWLSMLADSPHKAVHRALHVAMRGNNVSLPTQDATLVTSVLCSWVE